jgi:hypothetical protein
MGKVYFVKEPGGDSCVIMDATVLRDENELKEPLENLGMEFHTYHDWALTQSIGFFTVAKSKAEFMTAAFDLHYGKTVKKQIDRAKAKDCAPEGEDCAHCKSSAACSRFLAEAGKAASELTKAEPENIEPKKAKLKKAEPEKAEPEKVAPENAEPENTEPQKTVSQKADAAGTRKPAAAASGAVPPTPDSVKKRLEEIRAAAKKNENRADL